MDYASQGQAATKAASRINQDVERLLLMVKRVHRERERVVLHTSALGYYAQPTPETGESAKIQPITNNLANALNDLDRALDQLAGAVNLFE
jgi:hypothetical protein